MAIKTYVSGAWEDNADLKTNEIDGARESAKCAKIYVDGAWEDVWSKGLSVVENGVVQDGFYNKLVELTYDSETEGYVWGRTYNGWLDGWTDSAWDTAYSDGAPARSWWAKLEYWHDSENEPYYFDVSKYDKLIIDIDVDYDYNQLYPNSDWYYYNTITAYDELGHQVGNFLSHSSQHGGSLKGEIDVSGADKIKLHLNFNSSLDISYDDEYYDSITVKINTIRFE